MATTCCVETAMVASRFVHFELKVLKRRVAKEDGLFSRGIPSSCRRSLLASSLVFCLPKLRPTRGCSFFLDAAAQTHPPTELHAAMEVQNEDAPNELAENATKGDAKQEEEPRLSQQTLIWRAMKLPIYSVALVPLSVGSAVAFYRTKVFYAGCFGLLLGSAVLIITWLNLRFLDFPYGSCNLQIGTLPLLQGHLCLMCCKDIEPFLSGRFCAIASLLCKMLPIFPKLRDLREFNSYMYSLPVRLQIEGDRSVGKLSPLVRLGTERETNCKNSCYQPLLFDFSQDSNEVVALSLCYSHNFDSTNWKDGG